MAQIFYEIRNKCISKMNETSMEKKRNKKYCDIIWDEMMCWPKTLAGVEKVLPCPEYFGFDPKDFASKKCTENGKWFIHEELNTTWTNYSQCKRLYNNETAVVTLPPDLENLSYIQWWIPKIKTLTHVGYGLSLTTLVIAIWVFCYFKKLHCARNRLHLNLFLSFCAKASMSLLKDFLFVDGIVMADDVVLIGGKDKYVKEHNFWLCKAIFSVWQYFILTNYILILMEGIYLHNLLFFTLYSEKNNIMLYTISGWGLPICFITPWIILRILYDDEYCWTKYENKNYQLLIHTPIVISILINFLMFSKIINMLLVKLNSIYIQQQKIKYRRLIRSTLILMPLFGVPYIFSLLTWYHASINSTLEMIWIFFDQTFTSLQGFIVAFLYCLLNNDVQNELKRCFTSEFSCLGKTNRNQSFVMQAFRSNRTSLTINGNEQRSAN